LKLFISGLLTFLGVLGLIHLLNNSAELSAREDPVGPFINFVLFAFYETTALTPSDNASFGGGADGAVVLILPFIIMAVCYWKIYISRRPL
jgi:hypothetical protein